MGYSSIYSRSHSSYHLKVRGDGNIVYVGTDRGYINTWDIRYTSTVMSTIDIGRETYFSF